MEKIVLFGAGRRCREALILLSKEYEIDFIVDNDESKVGEKIEGIEVKDTEALKKAKDRVVVITPVDNEEIITQLSEMQVENIFTYSQNGNLQKAAYSVTRKKQLEAHELSVGKFLKLAFDETPFKLDNVCFRSGGSGVLDYAVLKGTMQYFNLKTYLEVGTYIGESISNVASIAEKCFSVTVPLDHPASMSHFCRMYGMVDFSNRLIYQSNIEQYLVDSKEFDFSSIAEDIDLYFIDGDHSMEGIENDTQKIWKHKGKDSFVIWHDVKKENNQINEITIEAIYHVLGNEGLKKFYLYDNCKCGIYVPEQYCGFFDSLCDYDHKLLYSYKLSMEINEK